MHVRVYAYIDDGIVAKCVRIYPNAWIVNNIIVSVTLYLAVPQPHT